jgi:predicted house-cleaning NTP pyrophosphatase (Maf/HAM1 superfamily)
MTSKQQFRLILGSSSPWRKRILSQLGYTFDVISPDIDEKGFFSVPQHSKTIIL